MAIIALHSKIGGGKDTTATIIQALDYYHNKSETNTKTKFTDVQFCLGVINNDYSYYSDWQVKKFADKLKDIVCILLGCSREQLECRDFKEKELGEEWWYWLETSSWNPDYKQLRSYSEYKESPMGHNQLIKPSPRLLLQLIGTQCFRDVIHPDTWCNSLISGYKEDSKWLVSDLRFPNELKAVKDKSGISIKIERDMRIFDGQTIPYYELSQKVSNPEIYKKVDYTHESETALDHITDWNYEIINDSTLEELIEKVKNILIKEKIIQK